MGFEVLNRRASRATGVAINVTKAPKSEKGKGLSGFFRIAPDVIEKAGWTDLDNMKVQIMAGNGPDLGVFLLKPSNDGRTKPNKAQSGASVTLSFSAMSAGFTEPTKGTTEVEYTVDGDEIRVTVPMLQPTKKTR